MRKASGDPSLSLAGARRASTPLQDLVSLSWRRLKGNSACDIIDTNAIEDFAVKRSELVAFAGIFIAVEFLG